MEPRHGESVQTPSTAEAAEKEASTSGLSRRTLGVVIVIGLAIVMSGVVASGLVVQPSDLLDRNGQSAADSELSNEVFEPPVNSTVLGERHTQEIEEAGSFTVNEEYSLDSTDPDTASVDETVIYRTDLSSDQILVDITTGEVNRIAYRSGTEKYERIEQPSGETDYWIPEREITTDQFVESTIIDELENIDVEHQETDSGHVYTASGVDTISDGFLGTDVDSFQSFEFEAVVSTHGVLTEFSYQIEVEAGGEVITVIRQVELGDIGETEIEEPTWLDDAREATE